MATNVILSCPFCHQKAEYRDAPPNSTVRCHECSSMFRVPANAYQRHRPGTVLKGEQAGGGSKVKLLITVILLLLIGGAGYYTWSKVFHMEEEVGDRYEKVAQYPLDKPEGVVERFLLAWKDGEAGRMLKYCRASDRKDSLQREKADKWFGNVTLNTFKMLMVTAVDETHLKYDVNIEGVDARTKGAMGEGLPLRGALSVTVVKEPEAAPEGDVREWHVDLNTAAPKWD